MSWILMLLKNLPAIMAAIQTILSFFTARAAFAAQQTLSAVASSGLALSDEQVAEQANQWNTYVLGQGAGSVGLLVSAALFALGQSTTSEAFAALTREKELAAEVGRLGMDSFQAASRARLLTAQLASLPASVK